MQLWQVLPPNRTEALGPRAVSRLGALSWIAALASSGLFHALLQAPFPGSSLLPILSPGCPELPPSRDKLCRLLLTQWQKVASAAEKLSGTCAGADFPSRRFGVRAS